MLDGARVEAPAAPRVITGPTPGASGFGAVPPSDQAPAAVAKSIARTGGFGDASVAQATSRSAPTATAGAPSAVEILSKPRPAYTAEARRLQIQGEVLLEVLFRSTGELEVQRVVRGLGYGLDESAADAARQIRFRPARRDGAPVDATAVVHISFELAL